MVSMTDQKKTLALLNSDKKIYLALIKKSENLPAFRWESPLQKGVIAIEFWLSIEVTEKFTNYSLQSLTVIRCVNKKTEFLLVYEIITRIYRYWNKIKWKHCFKYYCACLFFRRFRHLEECLVLRDTGNNLVSRSLWCSEHELAASIEPSSGWIYS